MPLCFIRPKLKQHVKHAFFLQIENHSSWFTKFPPFFSKDYDLPNDHPTALKNTMKFSSVAYLTLTAAAVVPSATSFVVSSSSSAPSTTALGVSSSTQKLSPPKTISELGENSEELYDENVQQTYG